MFSARADDAGMLNVVQSINAEHFQTLITKDSFQSRAFTAGLSKIVSNDYAEAVVEAIKEIDCRSAMQETGAVRRLHQVNSPF